ncbi:MAG: FGGY family carbohydrate kinase [bacterium]
MDLLIGLDLGTSALKGVLVSSEGEVLAQEKCLTQLLRPQHNYVEFSPSTHYKAVCNLIRELCSKVLPESKVKAISMAAASGNTLLLDKNNQPLTNIISWLDNRTDKNILPNLDQDKVHNIVGWPWSGGFPMAHLAWLKQNIPHVYNRACRFSMNTDYLLYRLTGCWAMDTSTATTFYLQDQVNSCWYKPYLDELEIKENSLSKLTPSGSELGFLTQDAANDTGLSTDTLVVLGAFDHPSAARGTGTLDTGDLLVSCGTSWVGFYPIQNRDIALSQNMLIDPFLRPSGPWGAMFSLPCVGEKIDWYIDNVIVSPKDQISWAEKYSRFNINAQKSTVGANGLYLNLVDDIKTIESNLSYLKRSYNTRDISRAVMEGVAYKMRERIEKLSSAGIAANNITMVGGPSESPIWPQIFSDVTGLEVKLLNGETAGALGAAILAGIGAGIFKDETEGFNAIGGKAKIITPDKISHNEYNHLFEEFMKRA